MRVPLLAALTAICAACADGVASAPTAPDALSLARSSEGRRGSKEAPPAYCKLSPAPLTLAPGATARLTVSCYASDGALRGRPKPTWVHWNVQNSRVATVDRYGRVRARAAGTTTLRMRDPRGAFSASMPVTVTGRSTPAEPSRPKPPSGSKPNQPPPVTPAPAPAPGPLPPPSGPPAYTGFPNQPAGMILITDRQFDSKARNNNDRGAGGSDGWDGIEYRFPTFSIVGDPTAPNGDGLVAQMFYGATMRSGTGPATAQIYFPRNVRQVYVSIWAKLSSNWVGNQSSTNKMFFIGVGGGNNEFFFSAEGAGTGMLQAQVRMQGVNDPRPRIRPNLTTGWVTRGSWQRWEFLLRCNSGPNMADGSIDLWIDGAHVTSVDDVNWTKKKSKNACDMNIFNWNPTYGGGGASPGVNQQLWFDRVYVSGK